MDARKLLQLLGRGWGGKVFALHMSRLGSGGKVMQAGEKDWRGRGMTALIAAYCTSPIERAGAFLVSSPCVLQLLLLWEGKAGREQVSKLSSFQAFTTNAGKLHRNTTRARLLLQSLPLTLCAHWPAAHRELISKHRHPTLASMPQRDVRAARS